MFVVCVLDPFCLLFKREYISCSMLKISLRYAHMCLDVVLIITTMSGQAT